MQTSWQGRRAPSTGLTRVEADTRGGLEQTVRQLLALADLRIDGRRRYDLQVHHPGFYRRVLAQGSLGLGESYMDGWWDAQALDELVYHLLRAQIHRKVARRGAIFPAIRAKVLNLQSRSRAFQVGEAHYDLGNEFFRHMLDRRMVYSCGYWHRAENLDEAQAAKLELICRKLGLEPGMRVLDIGCGWGSFARFAAEHYGVEVVGVTVSREQAELARQACAGLPVEIRLQDFRELDESFDHVVSVGMFEHVGHKNHREYLRVVHRCLADEGLFLLHTIGDNITTSATDPWINRYIFPNGDLPSLRQIAGAAERCFLIEDVHNFGADYDHTLMAWCANFERAWPQFKERYGERFYRMWRYYLLACAGAFRARNLQLWQLVLSKHGVDGGYRRP